MPVSFTSMHVEARIELNLTVTECLVITNIIENMSVLAIYFQTSPTACEHEKMLVLLLQQKMLVFRHTYIMISVISLL